jgi:hypothetical protein
VALGAVLAERFLVVAVPSHAFVAVVLWITVFKVRGFQKALAPHHINDQNEITFQKIKNSQRADNEMPIAGVRQVVRNWTHFRKSPQQFGFGKNLVDQSASRGGIIKGDIIGDLL